MNPICRFQVCMCLPSLTNFLLCTPYAVLYNPRWCVCLRTLAPHSRMASTTPLASNEGKSASSQLCLLSSVAVGVGGKAALAVEAATAGGTDPDAAGAARMVVMLLTV